VRCTSDFLGSGFLQILTARGAFADQKYQSCKIVVEIFSAFTRKAQSAGYICRRLFIINQEVQRTEIFV